MGYVNEILCFKVMEGIEWSQKALQRETASPQGMQSRCHLYIGIGQSILSANTTIKLDKIKYTDAAMDCFQKYNAHYLYIIIPN